MIHIIIGTKAQFIKVAPVIRELDRRGIPYRLIDTCQHKNITDDLRRLFSIRTPDTFLAGDFSNINTLPQALRWVWTIACKLLVARQAFIQNVFGPQPKGVCLIHGDTLSTLIGLVIAKAAGIRVGHLEAGLRSHNLIHPFPEELIRIICMRHADYLFAPSAEALRNLAQMKTRGTVIDTHGNTGADAVRYIIGILDPKKNTPLKPYIVMSIHRFETIYRPKRLRKLVTFARHLAEDFSVIFILHEPTMKRIERAGLTDALRHPRIALERIIGYDRFIALLNGAAFIITDGGSIQEESAYLGIPCLIMRMATERGDGIGTTAVLSHFTDTIIDHFLKNYGSLRRVTEKAVVSPSETIVSFLQSIPTRHKELSHDDPPRR